MKPDELLTQIAEFTAGPDVGSDEAWSTAHLCLLDSLGCALLALNYPECTKLLGPVVPGATLRDGVSPARNPHPVIHAVVRFCPYGWLVGACLGTASR